MIVSKKVEEFDFSIYNNVAGLKIINTMDILEIISYYRSDPFTLINLELLVNSYRIACTKNQNFEEGENCASTISVEHSFGSDMKLFEYDLFSDIIICHSGFNIQELLVLLLTGFINFGVTNQALQVSFNFVVEDSMLVLSYEFYDIIFCELLDISEAISDYIAQEFIFHSPKASLPIFFITCSSPHKTSKVGDILHPLGHLLLTLGADFTSHGLMFKAEI